MPASSSPSGVAVTTARNVYAGAGKGMFSSAVEAFPPRVYVPDEASGTVVVIDPTTYKILFRYKVGASPEHVTPDWDLQRLYVEAAFGDRLTIIDPRTGRPVAHHTVPGPYNLYFTLDGRMAVVVIDSARSGVEYGGQKQLRFYDRRTWRLIKALNVPFAGADHLDFSADGRFFLLSTEYAGWLVKVDVKRMAITGAVYVGGHPIDVRLSPDGRVFYVANQRRVDHRSRAHAPTRVPPDGARRSRPGDQSRRASAVCHEPGGRIVVSDRLREAKGHSHVADRRDARHDRGLAGRHKAMDLEPLRRHRIGHRRADGACHQAHPGGRAAARLGVLPRAWEDLPRTQRHLPLMERPADSRPFRSYAKRTIASVPTTRQ
jgi:YVTN family beta-propeller protein